ncbi:MAG: radical SAM protein [Candidatus Geothermarchaeales archaeon]
MNQGKDLIRVSLGTAATLGLTRCKLAAKPTTAYLMMYNEDGCTANCAFCTQAREADSEIDRLSRIVWPPYPLGEVLEALRRSHGFQRACLQALNYPGFFEDLTYTLTRLRDETSIPISLSCQPLGGDRMRELESLGLDTVAIPLDAATPKLFDEVKGTSAGGPYTWGGHVEALKKALGVLGPRRVYTHIIIGLGETEREALGTIQGLVDLGIIPGLFAFTPLPGTRLEGRRPPSIDAYRRVQLARFLILEGSSRFEEMVFDERGRLMGFGADEGGVREALSSGLPFITSGCPGCNRPYYNESPGGPLYNFPYPPSREKLEEIERVLLP